MSINLLRWGWWQTPEAVDLFLKELTCPLLAEPTWDTDFNIGSSGTFSIHAKVYLKSGTSDGIDIMLLGTALPYQAPSVNPLIWFHVDGDTVVYGTERHLIARIYDTNSNSMNTFGIESTAQLDWDTWYDITLRRNSQSEFEFLIDGVQDSVHDDGWSGSDGDLIPTALRKLTIGNFEDNATPTFLRQISFWNTAMSGADITKAVAGTLVGNESGLVVYYKLDEGAGDTLVDSTAKGLNGTKTYGSWEAI